MHGQNETRPTGQAGRAIALVLAPAMVMLGAASAFAQGRIGVRPHQRGAATARNVDAPSLRAAARREAIRLADAVPQPATPPQSGWIGRHPVIVGALIGTGAGAALSQVDAIGGKSHDRRVAVLGAGVGAWGGLIASAVRRVRAGDKVGAGTKVGIIAGAAALVALPVLACYGAGGCGGTS